MYLTPEWDAPPTIGALQTTRAGGFSAGPWSSMNLGLHCGDNLETVDRNRRLLNERLPGQPAWLQQVHGSAVLDWRGASEGQPGDAVVARSAGQVCAILTADCLPVLLCDRSGTTVAAVHAGWRGLVKGVIGKAVRALEAVPGQIMAWLGPSISAAHYEVGADLRDRFLARDPIYREFFRASGQRWRADLGGIARFQLHQAGVPAVFGGGFCTFAEPERFYSYRRDGVTGRMASLVWIRGSTA
ncbi:MAG: peptidoglycan editing factor PgeF [Xanthomonadales bacterium]|nr:peptidoglycan editing factor PgeF [Xanthomonadales bacterium]